MKKLKPLSIVFVGLAMVIGCSSDDESGNDQADGLVLQVLLDNDAVDSSGNGLNGEIVGSVTPVTNRNGQENSAMAFNENDGYIDFGTIEALEIGYESTISISVWIRPDGNQVGWDIILNQFFQFPVGPSAQGRFYLGINPDNQNVRWNILGYQLESTDPIPINTWTHLVVTYANKSAQLYINGSLDGELRFDEAEYILGSGAPFRIGKESQTSREDTGFSGAIDDINIYDRLLAEEEIEGLFNN